MEDGSEGITPKYTERERERERTQNLQILNHCDINKRKARCGISPVRFQRRGWREWGKAMD